MMTVTRCWVMALLAFAPMAWAQTPIDETKAFGAEGVVEIENVAGSVRVVVWDREEIHVVGVLEERVERVDFEVTDGRAKVDVVVPRHGGNRASADLTISVPKMKRLEVDVVSASVAFEGTGGLTAELNDTVTAPAGMPEDISIKSVSGDVRVNGSAQSLRLESVSGNVVFVGTARRLEVSSVSGSAEISGSVPLLKVETVSGDVRATGLKQEGSVSTTSGDIRVVGDGIKRLEMGTMSGEIEMEGSLAEGCRIDANSHSGDVTLRLLNDVSAEFSMETLSGEIEARVANVSPSFGKKMPGKEAHFTTGTGSGVVRIDTFSGDARVFGKS